MNKKRKKIISIWILIICLILLVYFIEGNYTIFYKLKELSLIEIFSLCALFIIFLWVNWIFFDTLSKSFNIKVKENFLLSVVTSFINLFTPFVGGMWFRARYTKKKYNLNYAHFTSCLFGNYIVVFLTSTFFGLLIFAYIYRRYKAYNIIFILLFFGIFLWSLFFVIFKKFRIKKKSRLFDIINKVSEWWQLISQNKQIIRKLTFLQIINLLIWVIQIYVIFYYIGYDISFLEAFYISIIWILAIFLKITPWNLWVTELLYVGSAWVIGIPAEIMLLVSLIKRAIEIIVLAILWPISNYILIKKIKNISKLQ
jgi:uncharacterized membrane protein YbhN (UPF0104 family)